MDKDIYIQVLKKTRKLGTKEECLLFENSLQALQGCLSVNDIEDICKIFYDDTKNEEVMFGLIHLIEQLRGEEYLKKNSHLFSKYGRCI